MKNIKVQLHLPNLYVGGIERWALTLMNGISDIEWFISTPEGTLRHDAISDEFSRFPIIHENEASHGMDALITTWGISNRSIAPTIAVAHSAFLKYREMMRAVDYDYAVAVSAVARTCFPDQADVSIIYNGVDVDRLNPLSTRDLVRRRLGIPEDAIVIGYVGRWGYQKNPVAAAAAAGQIPGAVALYVGPLPDDPSLVEEADRLAKCYFVAPDHVDRIGDLYACMDVCVFASRTEGFGLAIAEAWYAGIPVVATRVGIVAEHPDLVALLPDEPTPIELKTAVEKALNQKDRSNLNKAHQLVDTQYNGSVMIEKWRRYIHACIERS